MRLKAYHYLSASDKKLLRKIYENSFPKEERFPFWILRCCAKGRHARLYALIDHKSDKVVGMQFTVMYPDTTDIITYLMYFAIAEEHRNEGHGGRALKSLVSRLDNVLLCIEKPSVNPDDMKLRRKNFYLKSGFFETGYFIEDTGVVYELLSSVKGYKPDVEVLKKRYSMMTNNPVVKHIIKHVHELLHIFRL